MRRTTVELKKTKNGPWKTASRPNMKWDYYDCNYKSTKKG